MIGKVPWVAPTVTTSTSSAVEVTWRPLEDDEGIAGVREPRRPRPSPLRGGAALELSRDTCLDVQSMIRG